MTRYLIMILYCAVLLVGSHSVVVADQSGQVVRVAILNNADAFKISVRGRYKIVDGKTGLELASGKRLKKTTVDNAAQTISIGDQQFRSKHVRVNAQKDVALFLGSNMKRYRGDLDIILGTNDKFLLINRIDIETYVKGVLYHEVPHYWPLNAIKSQAIATRTYALYQIEQRKGEQYDVTSDIYSQVYGGRSAERHRPNIAANRTRGQVLTYQGQVLPAYFSSTCGGKTENVAALWKHDLPPLRGRTCGFCTHSPHYRWKKNFRSKDVQDQLNVHGFNLGLIEEIKVASRNKSGRVERLKITTRDGGVKTIPGTRFREILGPNHLKSNHYKIEMQGYYFDVIGRGWGHGVGMCQWGAYYMSKERYKYTSILDYYYPGTKISKITEL